MKNNFVCAVVPIMAVISLKAASGCTPPPTVQIYNTCPAGTSQVIDVTASPFCADPNATSDSTKAIQSALNAGVICRKSVYFPSGTYNVSNTLVLTGTPYQGNGSWQNSWTANAEIYGTGMSVIQGSAPSNQPLIDATGWNAGHLHDLTIVANPSTSSQGTAAAGLLLGVPVQLQNNPSNQANLTTGTNITLERLSVTANAPAIAAIVDAGSDLLSLLHSSATNTSSAPGAGYGLVVSATNVTGVQSLNGPLIASNGLQAYMNGTLATIRDSVLGGGAYGAPLWVDGMDAITVDGTYFQPGSPQGILVTAQADSNGPTRSNTMHLNNIHAVNTSNGVSPAYFINLGSSPAIAISKYGVISGALPITPSVDFINVPPGSTLSNYQIHLSVSNSSVPLIGGGGAVQHSVIFNTPGGLQIPASSSNVIVN